VIWGDSLSGVGGGVPDGAQHPAQRAPALADQHAALRPAAIVPGPPHPRPQRAPAPWVRPRGNGRHSNNRPPPRTNCGILIVASAQWGFGAGGWGKPPVDEVRGPLRHGVARAAGTDSSCVHQFGRPLYGDLSNIIVVPPPPEVWRTPRCTQTLRHVAHPLVGGGGVQASPVEKMTWGAMDDYEEEPEEEDEEDEENAEDGGEGGAAGAAAGEAGARGDDADDDDGKGTWRAGGRGAYTD
jgi:hypothetical protein